MKRLFAAALLALSSLAHAVTLSPVTLLNPVGSTAGQAIVSTGPTTAPAWSKVSATALAAQAANTVVANVTASSASPTAVALPSCSTANSALQYTSGTGFTCSASMALTTGTLAQFASTTSTQLRGIISDATGTAQLVFGTSPTLTTPTISTPAIANGTMSGTAITNSPISGNSGSFTTLAASSTVSGTGFSTYLASPPCVGCTTAGAGAFTTLSASGLITPSSTVGVKGTATNDSAQAGSVGEYPTPGSNTGTSLTTGVTANATSIPLSAGDWDVECSVRFNPAGTTNTTVIFASVNTVSATNGQLGSSVQMVDSGLINGQPQIINTPVVRVSLASSGTAYCPVYASFTTSTMTVDGVIRARRPR